MVSGSNSCYLQVFLGLVQETNLIQRLINVAYTYDNLAHRCQNSRQSRCVSPHTPPLTAVFLFHRVLKAQSDHRSRHEGEKVPGCLTDAARDVGMTDCFLFAVTHYSMWLLVSWAHCSSAVKSSLADSDHLHDWLRKLTLLVPEVSDRAARHFKPRSRV